MGRVLTAARECYSVYHPLRPWNLYCILGLLAVTGMRISQVVNLRPEEIDWERRVLTRALRLATVRHGTRYTKATLDEPSSISSELSRSQVVWT